ncbi:MAG: DUF4140 domain-containing protein [Nibricoccus sp.]
MKTLLISVAGLSLVAVSLPAQPALTIYNQNFAVVRERIALDLKAGTNTVTFSGVTTQVEPDSVVLRDPSGKTAIRILEQSYRADTLSQGLMLSLNEGKEIDFLTRDKDLKEYTVRGKIIRSGYSPANAVNPYAPVAPGNSPIIEVNGRLRFSLPGEPVFPALGDNTILKPTLNWQLAADRAAAVDAELGYITGGLTWQASYNLVSPEKGDTLDVIGWVTIQNESGKVFENATIKLMAGDVNKVQDDQRKAREQRSKVAMVASVSEAAVTEKAFDEFHLYALPRPVTLRDRETKQVEFLRATGVKAPTLYVYDGAATSAYRGWNAQMIRQNPEYGTQSNKKVWVMREFENKKENGGLGLPLPKGRTCFYRQDSADGRLEFTGENMIEHTAQGETVRIYTGDSFDLVGERKRMDFALSNRQDQAEESFEITLRNRKKEPVEIRVVERLYRGVNWEIIQKSDDFAKIEAQTIEFRVKLLPDEEKVVKYRVRYDWK